MSAFLSRRRFGVMSTAPSGSIRRTPWRTRGPLFGRSPWWPYLTVTLIGGGGFVGLLIAGNFAPQWAPGLRIAALIWFACFGLLRLTVFRRR